MKRRDCLRFLGGFALLPFLPRWLRPRQLPPMPAVARAVETAPLSRVWKKVRATQHLPKGTLPPEVWRFDAADDHPWSRYKPAYQEPRADWLENAKEGPQPPSLTRVR